MFNLFKIYNFALKSVFKTSLLTVNPKCVEIHIYMTWYLKMQP